MKKYTLILLVAFALSFSIQAQRQTNSHQKSSLFEGTIRTVVFEDEKGTQNHYLHTSKGVFPILLENEELSNTKVSVRGNLDDKGVLVPEKVEIQEQPKPDLQQLQTDLEQAETNFEQPITNFN